MTKVQVRVVRSALVLLVVGTLALSGCGGGSSGKSAATTTGPTAPKPTGSVINVGVIGSFSGAQASSSSQGATVAPAWERYVNEQLGGINGHPVKVYLADDKGDPATAQSAGKDLVDSKNVVALIVSSDNEVSAFAADATSKGVAVISGTANFPDWYTKPGMYPTPTDVASGLTAQVEVARDFGKAKKFADLYCAEVAACQQADPPLKAAAQKSGIGFISLAINSTAPSYTAECLKLKQENVDYAQLNFAASAAAKFVSDCQQQGYTPTWGSSEQAIGKDFLDIPNLSLYGPAYSFPSVAEAPPAQNFRTVMTRFAKDANWREGTGSFTWDGLETLRKALANAGPTVTRQDVTNGLNGLTNENLGGQLANPLGFAAGKTISFYGKKCYFVVGIKGGKTIAPVNLDARCIVQ